MNGVPERLYKRSVIGQYIRREIFLRRREMPPIALGVYERYKKLAETHVYTPSIQHLLAIVMETY